MMNLKKIRKNNKDQIMKNQIEKHKKILNQINIKKK